MAIKWEKKVTGLDVKRGNVSVTLKRIDDTDPEDIKTLNTCIILDALINTPELRLQVTTELKRQYEEQKVINDAATIGVLEDALDALIVEMEKP